VLIIDFWSSIESASKKPTEADFLDLLRQLDQSIESFTELPAAGDAIEQLAAIYSDRAEAKFAEIKWLNNSTNEPIVPLSEFDRYIRHSCVLDLDRFMLKLERYYPDGRAAAPERIKAEVLAAIIDDEEPLALAEPSPWEIAHDEDIKAWVGETINLVDGQVRSFSSLSRGRSIVQIWLSILLSENRLIATRNRCDFYSKRGIIVKDLNNEVN
jgi:hypothetical protein